jgi:hypothetical protein
MYVERQALSRISLLAALFYGPEGLAPSWLRMALHELAQMLTTLWGTAV